MTTGSHAAGAEEYRHDRSYVYRGEMCLGVADTSTELNRLAAALLSATAQRERAEEALGGISKLLLDIQRLAMSTRLGASTDIERIARLAYDIYLASLRPEPVATPCPRCNGTKRVRNRCNDDHDPCPECSPEPVAKAEGEKPYVDGTNCAGETAGQVANYLTADLRVRLRDKPDGIDFADSLSAHIDAALREVSIATRRALSAAKGGGEGQP